VPQWDSCTAAGYMNEPSLSSLDQFVGAGD
jgi:hypothetical protein